MLGQLPVRPAASAVVQAKSDSAKGQDAGLERQADLFAERLTRVPRGSAGQAPRATMAPSGGGFGAAPAPVRKLVQSAGQPLAARHRRGFEAGLGLGLGSVRIHDNARADAAAASLGALAFTYGSDIGFRAGRFAPDTQAGRTLLAHELVHVAQQGAAPRLQLKVDPAAKAKAPAGKADAKAARDERERLKAETQLLGLEVLYTRYWLYDWSLGPFTAVPKGGKDFKLRHSALVRVELDREFVAAGFANGVAGFEAALKIYRTSFERKAATAARARMIEYAVLLRQQRKRYETTNAAAMLAKAVAATRAAAKYDAGDSAQLKLALAASLGASPAVEHIAARYRADQAAAERMVAGAAAGHALVLEKDFDREALAENPQAARALLLEYIDDRLDGIAIFYAKIDDDPTIVYDLEELFEASLHEQGISPSTIYGRILRDRRKVRQDRQMLFDIGLGLVAIVAGLVTFGAGTAAVLAGSAVAFAAGAVGAVDAYRQYRTAHAAYLAKLATEDANVVWVYIAVVGSLIDAAAIAKAMKAFPAVHNAIQGIGASADAAKISALSGTLKRLGGLTDGLIAKVTRAAESEAKMQAAWKTLGRPSKMVFSTLLPVSPQFGRFVLAVYLSVRHGIRRLDLFLKTRQAIELLGDVTKLKPAELAALKQGYLKAIDEIEVLAAKGRKLGLDDDEVLDALQLRGGGYSPTDVEATMELAADVKKSTDTLGGPAGPTTTSIWSPSKKPVKGPTSRAPKKKPAPKPQGKTAGNARKSRVKGLESHEVAGRGLRKPSHWTKWTEYDGFVVYQRDDLFDLTRLDEKGRTNLERMCNHGLAPIDADDVPIEVHHLLQSDDAPLAEVTKTFHDKQTRIIHINPSSIPSGIDRPAFELWKRKYWRRRGVAFKQGKQ